MDEFYVQGKRCISEASGRVHTGRVVRRVPGRCVMTRVRRRSALLTRIVVRSDAMRDALAASPGNDATPIDVQPATWPV